MWHGEVACVEGTFWLQGAGCKMGPLASLVCLCACALAGVTDGGATGASANRFDPFNDKVLFGMDFAVGVPDDVSQYWVSSVDASCKHLHLLPEACSCGTGVLLLSYPKALNTHFCRFASSDAPFWLHLLASVGVAERTHASSPAPCLCHSPPEHLSVHSVLLLASRASTITP